MIPNTQDPAAASPAFEVPAGVDVQAVDKEALINEVNQFFTTKSQDRRPYEMDWFLNAAAVRMASDARMHPLSAQLEPLNLKEPAHRKRYRINRTRVKYLAKVAKYVNTRPRPIVIAASEDREDILDARLSQNALIYIWNKLELEAKYERVTAWAELTGKAFWAVWWDPEKLARLRDDETGEVVEAKVGDVAIDVVPAFEILVDDQGIEDLAGQKAIMRIKLRPVKEVEQRFGLEKGTLAGDSSSDDLFQFQRQIAGLGAKYSTGGVFQVDSTNNSGTGKKNDWVLVKEYFKAPTLDKPKGCFTIVAGGKMLRYDPELPYEFSQFNNPYPFEEFAASISPGQFWPSTMTEQLRPLQQQYSDFRNKLIEDLAMNSHGKLFVPRMSKIAENAWNSEAGEKIYFNALPGMPPPFVVHPPPLKADVWRLFDILIREFDEVSNITASSLGQGGDSESGYQTNLLQEANDAVFGPDRNRMQRALAGSLGKIRKLQFLGYTEQRMVTAIGRGNRASLFTFSQSNIDEAAEIRVQIGSALPDQKAARLQSVLELKGSGLFGDAENPRVRQGILELVDLGGIEQEVDPEYQDADRARLENLQAAKGMPLKPPLPWHKDNVHVSYHEDQLNATEFDTWPIQYQVELIYHYLLHLRKLDPQKGFDAAQMFSELDDRIAGLVPMFQQMLTPPMGAPPMGAPPGSPQPAAGGTPPMGAPSAAAPFQQQAA